LWQDYVKPLVIIVAPLRQCWPPYAILPPQSYIIIYTQPHLKFYRWNKTIKLNGTCTGKSK